MHDVSQVRALGTPLGRTWKRMCFVSAVDFGMAGTLQSDVGSAMQVRPLSLLRRQLSQGESLLHSAGGVPVTGLDDICGKAAN